MQRLKTWGSERYKILPEVIYGGGGSDKFPSEADRFRRLYSFICYEKKNNNETKKEKKRSHVVKVWNSGQGSCEGLIGLLLGREVCGLMDLTFILVSDIIPEMPSLTDWRYTVK